MGCASTVKRRQGEYALFQMPVTGGEPSAIDLPPRLRVGLELQGFLPRQSALLCVSLPCAESRECPVWSVPVPRGTPRRLGDLMANVAAVSPDGEWIVLLQADTHRRLLISRPDGSEARTLVDNLVHPLPWMVRWEPHGSKIRFSAAGPAGHDGEQWIWETSVEGVAPRPLYAGRWGQWTPDGRHFAFERWNEVANRYDAFVVRERAWPPWTHHQPVQLTSGPVSFIQLGPRPDGESWFAFGTDRRAELLRFSPGLDAAVVPGWEAHSLRRHGTGRDREGRAHGACRGR
jgi:hypothetical protein